MKKPSNLYRWTAFAHVGGIKYVVVHSLADRFHQLFHKFPKTDAIFEAQPVKEAFAFCTGIEDGIAVVPYSVLLFLRQCADRFFILGFQAKVVSFFLLAGFCLPPFSELALHPLLNHQINQFFYICTHKRPSLCWTDIIPVCFQDGIRHTAFIYFADVGDFLLLQQFQPFQQFSPTVCKVTVASIGVFDTVSHRQAPP